MVDGTVHWPDGDDLAKVQLVIIDLCDEYCCHGLVESGAIHVDGGAHGEHETDDAAVDVVVLQQALEGYRQRGRAGEEWEKDRAQAQNADAKVSKWSERVQLYTGLPRSPTKHWDQLLEHRPFYCMQQKINWFCLYIYSETEHDMT